MECGDEYIMLLYQFDEDEFARYKKKYLFCDVCGVGWWCSAVYLNTLNVIFRQRFVTDLLRLLIYFMPNLARQLQ